MTKLPDGWAWRRTSMGSRRHAVNVASRSQSTICGVQVSQPDLLREDDGLSELEECQSCLRVLTRRNMLDDVTTGDTT